MTTVWFTSDPHIGHELIAAHRAERAGITTYPPGHPEKADREIRWHDRTLAENWDAVVRPCDKVIVCGDLAVGGRDATAYALNWIADRPGEKILIPGNHDPVHPMFRDSHKWQPAYSQVFASVQAFARRRIGNTEVLVSHFPYEGDHATEPRFDQYRLRDYGLPIIHGHTHCGEKYSTSTPIYRADEGVELRPNQFHVGVDAWDMTPVNIAELAVLLEAAGW